MRVIYIIVLSILLFFSCKKEDEPIVAFDSFWGTVSALIDEVEWMSIKIYARNNTHKGEGINIHITNVDEFDISRNSIDFSKIPYSLGTYRLENANLQEDDGKVGGFLSFNDSDVLLAYFQILEIDSSSFITLESYDPLTNEIRGTFDATFILETQYDTSREFPDTIRFRNGIFHTKIIDY